VSSFEANSRAESTLLTFPFCSRECLVSRNIRLDLLPLRVGTDALRLLILKLVSVVRLRPWEALPPTPAGTLLVLLLPPRRT
jgi:hypothetical protein